MLINNNIFYLNKIENVFICCNWHLCLLLADLQIVIIIIIHVYFLLVGVPFLQTIQNLSIYVPNDDITLVCCSQYPLSPQIFQFFKADLMIHSTEQNKNCVSYMFKITTQQDIGPYYCAYKASENGTYVQSNLSDPITFQFAGGLVMQQNILLYINNLYLCCIILHITTDRQEKTFWSISENVILLFIHMIQQGREIVWILVCDWWPF